MEKVLPLVSRTSRYLGKEVNAIHKELDRVSIKIALAFPDIYEIGMSHIGFRILYHILNQRIDIAAERVFAPWVDLEAIMKKEGIPLFSLESKIPLLEFDIIGFSLQYELNYTTVLNMLSLARIPLRARERKKGYPLIIGGGPCTLNPEPIADFFDAFIIGDGEEAILEVVDAVIEGKRESLEKEGLLNKIASIEGVYVPALFDVEYNEDGTISQVRPKREGLKVRRRILTDLNRGDYPRRPVVPFTRIVHDRLSIEVARGCTKGCRFCQAGYIYLPYRERDIGHVRDIVNESIKESGYEEISFLSLNVGDYSCIHALIAEIMARYSNEMISISFPSLRIGTLTPEIMEHVKKVRKTGITLAPEAGTQRLRDVINKDINEDEILNTARMVFEQGWKSMKLYFMIGLPTEKEEDLHGIVEISKKALSQRERTYGSKDGITVNISTFIPKPHTPFQWVSQASIEEVQNKQKILKKGLWKKGIRMKWQDPRMSLIEGAIARGDRRLGKVIERAHELGCRLDGWSDHFRYDLWERAFIESGLSINFYTTRKREISERLPWDHIDSRVDKEFLKKEFALALEGRVTPDCRIAGCHGCGVCDDKEIKNTPYFRSPAPVIFLGTSAYGGISNRHKGSNVFRRFRMQFTKVGEARFLSHLELYSAILRALRRADIPLRFSRGHHPLPKVTFGPALPVGLESQAEYMDFEIFGFSSEEHILSRIKEELPDGISVVNFYEVPLDAPSLFHSVKGFTYIIELDGIRDRLSEKEIQERIRAFLDLEEAFISRASTEIRKDINVRSFVNNLEVLGMGNLKLSMRFDQKGSVRPTEVVKRVFGLDDAQTRLLRILKTSVSFSHGPDQDPSV